MVLQRMHPVSAQSANTLPMQPVLMPTWKDMLELQAATMADDAQHLGAGAESGIVRRQCARQLQQRVPSGVQQCGRQTWRK
eukprot:9177397-Alexandrium_andersonii.AAC.1